MGLREHCRASLRSGACAKGVDNECLLTTTKREPKPTAADARAREALHWCLLHQARQWRLATALHVDRQDLAVDCANDENTPGGVGRRKAEGEGADCSGRLVARELLTVNHVVQKHPLAHAPHRQYESIIRESQRGDGVAHINIKLGDAANQV